MRRRGTPTRFKRREAGGHWCHRSPELFTSKHRLAWATGVGRSASACSRLPGKHGRAWTVLSPDTDSLVHLSVCAAVAAGGASSPPSLLATSSLEHAPAHTWNWLVSILVLVRVLALTLCSGRSDVERDLKCAFTVVKDARCGHVLSSPFGFRQGV